ncbi:hypothetical protein ES288_D06G190300v1 [Gossypium darwinii]|uniref:Uncharacterized protein n=1 Tax=Gossypium darwinii TaxID=34276 RepID=A0A5D2CA09_GOSDA|nr:hypothetical protein ES288_D06G190300v1 [Gossypium darwinii]
MPQIGSYSYSHYVVFSPHLTETYPNIVSYPQTPILPQIPKISLFPQTRPVGLLCCITSPSVSSGVASSSSCLVLVEKQVFSLFVVYKYKIGNAWAKKLF